jgi:chorismate dehydratase
MPPKIFGIPNQLYTKPLTEPLRGNSSFLLAEEPRPSLAAKLREQELSAALLSPLDYAKESSEYRIVPNVGAISAESGPYIRFRDGARDIRTLAVDPRFACEIVLAKIILSESFDIEPHILPMNADVSVMLQKADAALLVGDETLHHHSENKIDVVEEWFELTGTPFVHAIWCGRENSLTWAEVEQLQDSQTKGVAGINDIAQQYSLAERDAVKEYLQSFRYALEEQDRESLAEFMRYLYYHGVLPDVAELNFYRKELSNNDLLSAISPN